MPSNPGSLSTAFACPFAGAIDPAQTLQVVERLLEGMGIETGVDGQRVASASQEIEKAVGHPLLGRVDKGDSKAACAANRPQPILTVMQVRSYRAEGRSDRLGGSHDCRSIGRSA